MNSADFELILVQLGGGEENRGKPAKTKVAIRAKKLIRLIRDHGKNGSGDKMRIRESAICEEFGLKRLGTFLAAANRQLEACVTARIVDDGLDRDYDDYDEGRVRWYALEPTDTSEDV